VSPRLACSSPYAPFELKSTLYENPECIKFSIEDTSIQLTFRVQCRQTEQLGNKTDGDPDFAYFVDRKDDLNVGLCI
jgi:hypothetical protein